jgi:hypothetical protein
MIKITTPNEMNSGISKLEEALNKFEERFSREDKDITYYHLVIDGEYNRPTCDEIKRLYKEAGWKLALCKTSSEYGERGGLTSLRLYSE